MTDTAAPAEIFVPSDRHAFFEEVRRTVFHGHLNQGQVDGINGILDYWERRFHGPAYLDQLSYVLGTTWWETGKTMRPVPESGRGRGHRYGAPDPETGQAYYGRGYVQLTWKENYAKLSRVVLEDLVHDPDRAMEPAIAAKVLVEGMLRGLFTGKRLGSYFTASKKDWLGARRIVNGTDRAAEIAAVAQPFFAALEKLQASLPAPPMPEPKQPKVITMKIDVSKLPPAGQVVGYLGALAAVAMAFNQPQVAALLSGITPDTVDGLYKLVTLGGGVISLVAGLLPNSKADA